MKCAWWIKRIYDNGQYETIKTFSTYGDVPLVGQILSFRETEEKGPDRKIQAKIIEVERSVCIYRVDVACFPFPEDCKDRLNFAIEYYKNRGEIIHNIQVDENGKQFLVVTDLAEITCEFQTESRG